MAPNQNRPFPRAVLAGAAFAVGASMILAAAGRQAEPEASPFADAGLVAERTLRFEDLPGGAIAVFDVRAGVPVTTVESGQGHFLRATLRGLVRERRAIEAGGGSVGKDQPFRVAAWNDGRVTLDDLATGRRVELVAFGHSNVEAFARLLPEAGR